LKLGFQAELNCDYLGYYHSQERASRKSSFEAAIFRPPQTRPQQNLSLSSRSWGACTSSQ
jgi:hypothetical protein